MAVKVIPGRHDFLREIPPELCEELRMRASISRPVTSKPKAISLQATGSYKLGQRVSHAKIW